MTAISYMRGHQIYYNTKDKTWKYIDDDSVADDSRPCVRCGKYPTQEGYDACLKYISNVSSACCSHGRGKPYVVIKKSSVLYTKWGNAKINEKGYYRISSSKEGNYNKYLHRLIFEDFYGPIPDACYVHHKDGNPLNNCVMNLQLLTKSEHSSLHNTGKNHPMYGKIGEKNPMYGKTGNKSPKWKDFARVVKIGFSDNGKQRYALKFEGKIIKKKYL